jgi:hypothetical protein
MYEADIERKETKTAKNSISKQKITCKRMGK